MELRTEPFVLNMGPQHPSTHGVFRMRVTYDGEVVMDLEPMFGYLHRGIEKLAETRTYTQFIPLTDRLAYLSSMTNNHAYVLAVEKLAGITVPERAEYIRVIMDEMMRISSHLMAVGFFLNDLGCSVFTPLLYMYREREKLLDLFEMVCGQRLTYNYMRIGGVSHDLPEEFMPALKQFVAEMPSYIEEYEALLAENEILLARTKGVGILPRELAINASVSGPVLRASGVKWDIRKVDPYSVYDRFEFDIPTGEVGDNYDRYRVRIMEMQQSLRILRQAIEQLPEGEVCAKVPQFLRPPKGEAYGRIEGPQGELGFYIVSDNSIAPYRLHIRPPTLINLTALRDMIRGWKLADAIATFGSIDICLGEVDR
ncbi:MAG: NADH-quinone oxidoreductase subunit D [Chloroflexi bacterium]|nr:MAG: NADH-quinone oxidoreductase subunit D [Chloroflexota bacterium]RLC95810.1 MAG: NADH-quinone oxidoreductase subunit D [Chloroflexota bacterium]